MVIVVGMKTSTRWAGLLGASVFLSCTGVLASSSDTLCPYPTKLGDGYCDYGNNNVFCGKSTTFPPNNPVRNLVIPATLYRSNILCIRAAPTVEKSRQGLYERRLSKASKGKNNQDDNTETYPVYPSLYWLTHTWRIGKM